MQLPSFVAQLALMATHRAAISCHKQIGNGDKYAADAEAVNTMRQVLNSSSDILGTIVIGEGEMDEAPMLYIGEQLGSGAFRCDIAVDPLEGTTLCAKGLPNAITTIAISTQGSILHAPDMYMEKIASCKINSNDVIHIDNSVENNIKNVARYLNKTVSDVGVCVLERERHSELIKQIRAVGAKVFLISDGDIAGILQTNYSPKVDLYIGSGGAPEGVLAAAAIKSFGGFMQGRLLFESDNITQIEYAKKMGIVDLNKIYGTNDMIKDDVIFAATGVTNGFLDGVMVQNNNFYTTSLLTNSSSKIIQNIVTQEWCINA